jgi:dipeptidyl aminopeptidase/acylaminoacyl peptidase
LIAVLAAAVLAAASSTGAASQPLTPRELVELRDLSGLAVAPNGEHAVVRIDSPDIETNRVHLAWYLVALKGHRDSSEPGRAGGVQQSDVRDIADAGDPNFGENGIVDGETPSWSADSQWIYYRALHNQEMQVWRTHCSDGRTEQLTHDAANIKSILLDEGQGRLFYWVGADRQAIIEAEQQEYDRGVLIDGTVIPGFPVARSYPIFGRMSMYRLHRHATGPFRYSHDGLLSEQPDQLRVLTLSSGVARPASEVELAAYQALVRQRTPGFFGGFARLTSPDGKRVAAVDGETEGSRLNWTPAEGGSAATLCRVPECVSHDDSLKVIGWLDAQSMVFTNQDLSGQALYVWDVAADRVRRFAFSPGLLAGDRYGKETCALGRGETVCITSSAGVPPRLEAISVRTGKARLLYDSNPNLTAPRLGIAERLRVKNEYGDEMAAFLILPRQRPAGVRLPLVITSYACDGFVRGGSGDDISEHLLAAAGIAAVCINDNSSSSRVVRPGDRWANSESSSLAFRQAVVQVLDRRGLIDPHRVGVTGLSYGATTTLNAIMHTDQFAVAEITSQGYEDPIAAWLQGAPPKPSPLLDPAYFQRVSPALNADKIHTPLLMLLGDTEYVQMLQLYTNLRDLNKPVEMRVYPEEYHIKGQPRHRLSVYEQSSAWLRFWLLGKEDPDETERERYAGWERLCDAQVLNNPGRTSSCVRSRTE